MSFSIAKLEKVIEAAAQNGCFEPDYLYEYEPHVTAKLLADRKILLEAAETALKRMIQHTPSAILLAAAIEAAHAGWPKDESEA